jgi:hypothetical protein
VNSCFGGEEKEKEQWTVEVLGVWRVFLYVFFMLKPPFSFSFSFSFSIYRKPIFNFKVNF